MRITWITAVLIFMLISLDVNAQRPNLISIEISLGGNNEAKEWDGTLTFKEKDKGNSFMYVNSNKGWRDGSEVNLQENEVSWKGKSKLDKEYDWVIYNNKFVEGYTPKMDIRPFKPFIIRVNFQTDQENPVLEVNTVNGAFDINIKEITYYDSATYLNGNVHVQRIYPTLKLTDMMYFNHRYKYHGFPALASNSKGETYVAYSTYYEGISPYRWHAFRDELPDDFSYLAQEADGDRLNVLIEKDGKVIDKFPITEKGKDIFDVAMVKGPEDKIWIAWSERVNNNQDIYYTQIVGNKINDIQKLTSDPGPDIHPVMASDENDVWIAWQGFRNGSFDILYSKLSLNAKGIIEKTVGKSSANEWQPAIATNNKGHIAIAWDTYKKGDYDVYYAIIDKEGTVIEEKPVAATLNFEARPSVVFDDDNRLWVAYEITGKNWGKDNGSHFFIEETHKTEGLYEKRSLRVVAIKDGEFYSTPIPVHEIIPKEKRYSFFYNKALHPNKHETANTPTHYLNFPVLAKDKSGKICLVYKRQPNLQKSMTGTIQWWSYLTYFNGKNWSKPVLLHGSFSQMHEKPHIINAPGEGIKVVHASDRQGNKKADDPDQFAQNIWMSYPEIPEKTYDFELSSIPTPSISEKAPMAIKEEKDLEVIRNYRTTCNGKTYRILKGDSHRHSSLSGDGGGDSQLEDSYRYALDASGLDWFSNGDHDNGYNEYYWNLTQKYTDIFHIADYHTPPFGYERSCRFPDGHRNVLFTQRGIRMLPRLKYNVKEHPNSSPDTRLLYKYLDQFDGICVSHTSATTTAGTDWRELDTKPEPVIEIYQGERMSAECLDCPRFRDDIPYHPINEKGTYHEALNKGHHLGIISSSDHRSTHSSFAMVYADEFSREGIMNGLKNRRTYGATDNIVLDVKTNGHIMGEVIQANDIEIDIHVIGTEKIKEIIIIKNGKEYPVKHKGDKEIKVQWKDKKVDTSKENYYYVRILQEDGEVAWSSPVWTEKA